RWGRIKSLQVDNVDILEIDVNTGAPNGVGVGLDFRCPKGAGVRLIALQDDDEAVWNPLELKRDPTTSNSVTRPSPR
ncbi:MAG: hypothetical protein LBU69_03295, partial [Deltaproteobacteria bacterium]|nr:hypothetical protein [Deltaproteobacteria bacterium]